MKKFGRYAALLLSIAMLFGGCGGKVTEAENPDVTVQGSAEASETPSAADGGRRTLTIWTLSSLDMPVVVSRFEREHPDIDVEFRNFTYEEHDQYCEQMKVALMSGKAPDLFVGGPGVASVPSLVAKGYLADFYPIMEADPLFDKGKYYTNVWDAASWQGGLYSFPRAFYYEMIGINRSLPDGAVAQFSQWDAAYFADAAALFNAVTDKKGLDFADRFTYPQPVAEAIPDYIDYAAKTCRFTDRAFVRVMEETKAALSPEKYHSPVAGRGANYFLSDVEESRQFAFKIGKFGVYQYLLPYESDQFVGTVPFADADGKLMVNLLDNLMMSATSKSKDLAWEFLKLLVSDDVARASNYQSISVNRKVMQSVTEKEVRDYLSNTERVAGEFLDGTHSEHVKAVWERLSAYNEMPMNVDFSQLVSSAEYVIVMEEFELFYKGMKTAEDAAAAIQNKVTLMLQE